MKDKAMEIAAMLTRPPICVCENQTEYEYGECDGDRFSTHYVGKVRIICSTCGKTGAWHKYNHFGVSIPELSSLLETAARRYNAV